MQETIKILRRQAILSALVHAAVRLAVCATLLLLPYYRPVSAPVTAILHLSAALNIVSLLPLAYSLRQRIKEIEKGEEYEARQY